MKTESTIDKAPILAPEVLPPAHSTRWGRLANLDLDALSLKEIGALLGAAGVALAALAWLLLGLIEPMPESRLAFAAGPRTGAYFQYGMAYRERLAAQHIELEVLATKGSIDNGRRLADDSEKVQVGLLQGGADMPNGAKLEALATVAIEPIWVFMRPGVAEPKTLAGLRGLRVGLGAEGSGTLPVARALLDVSGLQEMDVQAAHITTDDAVQAVAEGRLDALVAVAAVQAPVVRRAFALGLRPMPLPQGLAFARRFDWLAAVSLPRGSVSIGDDLPEADLPMLAVRTHLVVREDTSESVKALLTELAFQVHGGAGPLNSAHAFPSSEGLPFAQSASARRVLENGSTLPRRWLPFRWADAMHRLMISVLPVVVLALPALQMLGGFAQRRNRAAILRLYLRAQRLLRERRVRPHETPRQRRELAAIEALFMPLRPNVAHAVEYYRLVQAIERLRGLRDDTLMASRAETSATEGLARLDLAARLRPAAAVFVATRHGTTADA